MIHIYTGDGKGKTTAALGLALRAVGAGKKVLIIQFLKTGGASEARAIRKFLPDFQIKSFGRKGFIKIKPALQKDVEAAQKALKYAKEALSSKKYNFVILDEINVAIKLGLLDTRKATDLIKKTPKDTELVLTGRNAKPEIIKLADLATEMKMIKHYYNKGVKARKGIEF